MNISRVTALATVSLFTAAAGAISTVVNIDAQWYGYQFPTDPAPHVGQVLQPLTSAPGGGFNELTLAAGTYRVRNATGMPGADPSFTGWRFNGRDNWVWSVVITKASGECVFYTDAGGVQSTQAAIAAQPDVPTAGGTFTLDEDGIVRFMIRDYGLSDNAGGVAVVVTTICTADFNNDSVIDLFDYLDFVDAFSASDATSDFNHDGHVDLFDYLDFVNAFSRGC